MANNVKPAGSYKLKSFTIHPFVADTNASASVNIKMLIHTWEIIESIMSGATRGSAKVYDATGVIYDFPLRGQERITIEYEDWRGETLTENYVLYAITDAKPFSMGGDSGIEYKINFVSVGKFVSDKYDVRRCVAQGTGETRTYIPVSEQAEVLFTDYFYDNGTGTEKPIYVTPSDGPQKIVIPSMRPEDAMHLLSRKAWSADFASQNYRFFETREKYYFANIEDLIKDQANKLKQSLREDGVAGETRYVYSTRPVDNMPDSELMKMESIIAYEYPSLNNSHENMLSGAFYRKTNELNLSQRMEIVNEYIHIDEYADYLYPDNGEVMAFMNSNEFIETQLNKFHYDYVVKDYPAPDESPTSRQRPTTYYPDIYNNKGAMNYHFNASKVYIKIFGNNRLFPGMTMEVVFPNQIPAANRGQDTERSGRYLIESIKNTFHEFTYYQDITLIKGAILEA